MLIYISGMSSTGKTTLMHELESVFQDKKFIFSILGIPEHEPDFISEVTRSLFRSTAPAYMDFNMLISNPEEYLFFMDKVFQKIQNEIYSTYYRNPNRLVFCDRAPIDYRINLSLNYNNGDPEMMEHLKEHYLRLDGNFSRLPKGLIFMTNPHKGLTEVEYDGFRPEKYAYRRAIEKQYFQIASKSPDVSILPEGVIDRVGFIIRSIILKG